MQDGGVSDALHSTPRPAPERRRLSTTDGVHLDSVLIRSGTGAARGTAVVLANGFTGTWRSPHTKMIASRLLPVGDVMTFDFRGHRASTGASTVGNDEVNDVQAVVEHLRGLGYTAVATVGFSMGAAVVIRHAALFGGVSAVVAVSGPSQWYYRGSRRMRLLHFGVEQPVGRWFLRVARQVRVTDREWNPRPQDPVELAPLVAPAPLLVVHGDRDGYFPVDHAHRIHDAAHHPKELWIEPGMNHAERGVTPRRAERISQWLAANQAVVRERERLTGPE
ncbi:pimeloyl-ACP methyl ester carboxylesterase [Nocardiopsis mwathae]|uniref:Pimeloyl-ACP methyl ester carboxylesterase n=1 Tax=Nocardiopsis mwathae TaxID=1472723 RepID=A0A7X0D4N4_9ACTN|nr:alpha/beta hydrolase [Nocardiopsis mwathae]MBB6170254.1 pimeloyl-ACP methyl ester carboxylesterase [Nocardiopsis mwathae]